MRDVLFGRTSQRARYEKSRNCSSKFKRFGILLPALVANEIDFEETFVSSIILPGEPFLTCSIFAKKDTRRLCSEGDHLQTSDSWIKIFLYTGISLKMMYCEKQTNNNNNNNKTK